MGERLERERKEGWKEVMREVREGEEGGRQVIGEMLGRERRAREEGNGREREVGRREV